MQRSCTTGANCQCLVYQGTAVQWDRFTEQSVYYKVYCSLSRG